MRLRGVDRCRGDGITYVYADGRADDRSVFSAIVTADLCAYGRANECTVGCAVGCADVSADRNADRCTDCGTDECTNSPPLRRRYSLVLGRYGRHRYVHCDGGRGLHMRVSGGLSADARAHQSHGV